MDRLRLLVILLIAIGGLWVVAGILGLRVTQSLAALLAIPYAGYTAYLVWARGRRGVSTDPGT